MPDKRFLNGNTMKKSFYDSGEVSVRAAETGVSWDDAALSLVSKAFGDLLPQTCLSCAYLKAEITSENLVNSSMTRVGVKIECGLNKCKYTNLGKGDVESPEEAVQELLGDESNVNEGSQYGSW